MTMRWRKSGLGADFAAGVTTLGPGLSLGYGPDGSVYLDAVADAGNVDSTLGYGTYDARYAPLSHASRHASGGADPITPAMIGAAAVSDLAGYVPTSRQVIAGTGLTGGGNLTSNRTLSFDTSWGDARYLRHTDSIDLGKLSYSSHPMGWVIRANGSAWTAAELQFSDIGGTLSAEVIAGGTLAESVG